MSQEGFNYTAPLNSKDTQNLEFWRGRLRKAANPLNAIGIGFNWDVLDSYHKPVICRFIKSTQTVLDIGCGIGRTATWFRSTKYLGIDFVPEFIEIARKNNPEKEFAVVDITRKLPYKDGQFDWGFMISVRVVIEPVIGGEKWKEVEGELKRVCKNVLVLEYANQNPAEMGNYEIL